jgi:ribosomal protein S18 acetylase RimI-like enzyme
VNCLSQYSIHGPWLPPFFEREGFRAYWREFMRCKLRRAHESVSPPAMMHLESLRETDLHEAAPIMLAAYGGGIDAEISVQYRTYDGCKLVLESILSQGSCGIPVIEASALARHRGRAIGFIILTEIAQRQGHLGQFAVLPAYQRQGLGRLVVSYGLSRSAELGFDTLSLIVTRTNWRALIIGCIRSSAFNRSRRFRSLPGMASGKRGYCAGVSVAPFPVAPSSAICRAKSSSEIRNVEEADLTTSVAPRGLALVAR